MRKLAIFALLAACALWVNVQAASAQRSGGGIGGARGGGRAGGGFAHALPAQNSAGPLSRNLISGNALAGNLASRQNLDAFRRLYRNGPYGDLFSSLGLLSDYASDPSTYGNSSAPPNFFLLPSLPSGGMEDRSQQDQPRPGAQPLMIELRGDRYVRISGDQESSANDSSTANYQQQAIARASNASAKNAHTSPAQPAVTEIASASPARPAQDLQPAVLIFRDGHTENVRDYAITGGMLYARGDFYTDGYWTRTVALANLNIPATLTSNADRGVKFVLPGAPNEVVTRP